MYCIIKEKGELVNSPLINLAHKIYLVIISSGILNLMIKFHLVNRETM